MHPYLKGKAAGEGQFLTEPQIIISGPSEIKIVYLAILSIADVWTDIA